MHGRTVWHGLERHVDIDGDGNDLDDPPVAIPYDTRLNDFFDFEHTVPYRLDGAGQQLFLQYPVAGTPGRRQHREAAAPMAAAPG